MGLEIDRIDFEEAEYEAFAAKLRRDLEALELLLARPGFGEGPDTIGAEVELALVDGQGRPQPINRDVMADAPDPRLALELDRFNLEYNSTPRSLAGASFSALAAELRTALDEIEAAAIDNGGRVALVGILPTLHKDDLQSSAMTESKRFKALSRGIKRLHPAPFRIEIDGDEKLDLECDDVTMEGANTSFQLHLRVTPDDFARTFNAAQLAAAPVLAVSSNSPIFLSRVLWHETRVALFGRAVEYRVDNNLWRPARVTFGHGWVRRGALECFAESVALHSPLLPVVTGEDPVAVVAAGGVPALCELKLHHGTVWSWNRAVFDPADGGHLRVELRALPTGPTVADMAANAAFLIGLTLGLRDEIDHLIPAIPFRLAHDNFYRAARDGLDSMLLWPSRRSPSPDTHRAIDLAGMLLPVARRGLEAAHVDAGEIDLHLGIIDARLRAGCSGARWLRAGLTKLERKMPRGEALTRLMQLYLEQMKDGAPVAQWDTP